MTDSGLQENPHVLLVLAVVFVVIVVGGTTDLVLDQPMPVTSLHLVLEVLLVVFSLGAAAYLGVGWFRTYRAAQRLQSLAERAGDDRDAWRARAGRLLAGLGQAVEEQFDAWALTEAERATALMLLKGGSHKAIARATDRSERTVRQHAVAVYRKSGLAGRAELAGFFLGGLLLPRSEAEEGQQAPEA